MIKQLFVSSTSVCLEWQNNSIYERTPYSVILDGEEIFSGTTNVFSLFNLKPSTEYTISTKPDGETFCFVTKSETCCLSVRDFGAKGDGKTDDTRAIQSAIDVLPKHGRLTFPKGTYLVSPIVLKSHITVELCKDAVLLGSTNEDAYLPLPGELDDQVTGQKVQIATWEGEPVAARKSLVCGWHIRDTRIVGQGTIDGNAQNATWWQFPKKAPGRPRLVFLNNCSNIDFHGITGQNAASWQFHPYFSSEISFFDISINAPKDSPNTDGLDPESCDGVNIIGCKFSVGDDCIAIKSGKYYMGKKYKRAASRHIIRNCLMQFGHGAVTFGSEMAGGIKDITVNRCRFYATDRGLRIKTRRGRGENAQVDGIVFENIQMDEVLTPIVMNMWYNKCDPDRDSEYVWSREKLVVDDRTPYLGVFEFRDMTCTNCHFAAVFCDGLPEQPVKKVTLKNLKFTYNKNAEDGYPAMMEKIEKFRNNGLYFDNVEELVVHNVSFEGVEGEQLVAKNVGKIVK